MDTVLLFNGLGNQMSQYAFYLAKKKVCISTHCIYFSSKFDNQHNGFELERVFGIKLDKGICYYLSYALYFLYNIKDISGYRSKLIRKILWILNVEVVYEDMSDYGYNYFNIEKSNNLFTFFWGGWHNEEYFIDLDLKNIFRFDSAKIDSLNNRLSIEMSKRNSVSIHIRRGDYLNENLKTVFGNICSLDYYKAAIDEINSRVEEPFFYIFTDDKQWVEDNFKLQNSRLVDLNSGKDSWKDLYLMSQCKHNINANSTFSWWAAYLNSNISKIVIVPDRFTSNKASSNIYPKSWIKIDTKTHSNI